MNRASFVRVFSVFGILTAISILLEPAISKVAVAQAESLTE